MRVEFFREVSTDKRRAASEIAQKVFSKVTIHSVKRKVNLPCAFFFPCSIFSVCDDFESLRKRTKHSLVVIGQGRISFKLK